MIYNKGQKTKMEERYYDKVNESLVSQHASEGHLKMMWLTCKNRRTMIQKTLNQLKEL
jgi:hypothetical protein